MPAPEIRPATLADAEAIGEIAREVHAMHAAALPGVFQPVGPDVLTRADIETMLTSSGRLLLVAVRDGAVVGYASAEEQRMPPTAFKRAHLALHVHAMGVAARERSRGTGHALLEALRAEARARSLPLLTLEVYDFNAGARAFYVREGLEPVRLLMQQPVQAPATAD